MAVKKTPGKKATAKKTSVRNIATVKTTKKKTKITRQVSVFARTSHKSQEWIKEMHRDLKWMSGDSIYHLLRSVLHALRDQLSINEAAHFAAQLPLLLRGTFFEGWDPKMNIGNGATKEDFLQNIKSKMGPVSNPNFELEKGVLVALNVIKKHISAGEMKDIVGLLNPSLKVFFNKNVSQKEASL